MTDASTLSLQVLAGEIRRLLERTRQTLDDEIRHYPTPIPRCDAQFNHLYEQRSRLARVLDTAADTNDQALSFVREFVASTPFTDSESERALRSHASRAAAQS